MKNTVCKHSQPHDKPHINYRCLHWRRLSILNHMKKNKHSIIDIIENIQKNPTD